MISLRGPNRRRETKFQDHIIKSYLAQGGAARKWATDLQVGVPDLIASLDGVGVHLVEVKHRPEWRRERAYGNPLDAAQIRVAREFVTGGALVVGAVVIESPEAKGAHLVAFDPIGTELHTSLSFSTPYVLGAGFDMRGLVGAFLNGRIARAPDL
jgi:hypothetical protein